MSEADEKQHQAVEESIDEKIKSVESFQNMSLDKISSLNENESTRYEHYRRSHFDRALIKRIMTETAQHTCTDTSRMQPISQTMTVVMSGAAKMFVGDLTIAALKIMKQRKESGPIQPRHLREAFRQYRHTKAGRSIYSSSENVRMFY